MDPVAGRTRFKFGVPIRVRMVETDMQGNVHHGAFFGYFEAGRMDYWDKLGCPLSSLRAQGVDDSIVAAEALYRSPARFYDLLHVHVRTGYLSRRSYGVEFLVTRGPGEEAVAEGRTFHVMVDLESRRPVPVPGSFREAIAGFEGADLEIR